MESETRGKSDRLPFSGVYRREEGAVRFWRGSQYADTSGIIQAGMTRRYWAAAGECERHRGFRLVREDP